MALPLYDTVNTLFHLLPESLQDTPYLTASVAGAVGAFGAIGGLQLLSKYAVDRVITGFDEKALPFLEKACMAVTPLAAMGYGMLSHSELADHSVYTVGTASALVSAMITAGADIVRKEREQLIRGPGATL